MDIERNNEEYTGEGAGTPGSGRYETGEGAGTPGDGRYEARFYSEEPVKKKGPGFGLGIVLGLVLGICGTGVVCLVALVIMYNTNSLKLSFSSSEKLGMIENMIRERYLHEDEVTDEMLEDGMYKGMVESLGDPYSVYYTEKDYSELMDSTSGSFGGVGIVMSQDPDTKDIVAIKVNEDSPADKVGVSADDILIKVNGEDIKGQDLSTVVSKIRGEVGTSVNITVLRGEEELSFDIVRDVIKVTTVTYRMEDEDKKEGYIYISEFDDVTYEQFMDALEDLKGQGMKSLLLDLRSNPGGNLNTVCDICDELLPEGRIVYVEDKNGKTNEYTSDAGQSYKGPMVVLVDENSASASEILTGALKDYGLAKIVGKKTFGKGIVQSVYPLGDGTALKLTVEDYFTPNGHNIHGKGIEPDVEVDLDEEAYKKDQTDTQLEKAKKVLSDMP